MKYELTEFKTDCYNFSELNFIKKILSLTPSFSNH